MDLLSISAFTSLLFGLACADTFHIQTDEVFTIPLSPSTFNLSDESTAGVKAMIIQYSWIFCILIAISILKATFILATISSFVFLDTYTYSASLHGLPDLPSWIHITHNHVFKMGFLYGTPPNLESTIKVYHSFIFIYQIIISLFRLVGSSGFESVYI